MIQIVITGASGIVGQTLCNYLRPNFQLQEISRLQLQKIRADHLENAEAIVHLAAKAHDLNRTANPDAYYQVNYGLTKQLFDAFIQSNAKSFVFISSVKAATDEVVGTLTENFVPNPQTHYGKSKHLAEQYLLSTALPAGKEFYILRPCMIHGPGNKGNLDLL